MCCEIVKIKMDIVGHFLIPNRIRFDYVMHHLEMKKRHHNLCVKNVRMCLLWVIL